MLWVLTKIKKIPTMLGFIFEIKSIRMDIRRFSIRAGMGFLQELILV